MDKLLLEDGIPLSLEGKGTTEEVRLDWMEGRGLMLVAGERAMKEGEARGLVVEGEKEEWVGRVAVAVAGEVSMGLVVVSVGGAMISDLCKEGEESLEGEVVVVGVDLEEPPELASVLLEWCLEKWGLGEECLLEVVSSRDLLCAGWDWVDWEVVSVEGAVVAKLGFDRTSGFSGSFFLFLL